MPINIIPTKIKKPDVPIDPCLFVLFISIKCPSYFFIVEKGRKIDPCALFKETVQGSLKGFQPNMNTETVPQIFLLYSKIN